MSVDTNNSDKLLIVDGEPSVIKALVEVFRTEPYLIMSTTDANEAIAIAGREKPAVVLCGMDMPGLNGVDLLKEILNVSPHSARVLLGDDKPESIVLVIDSINLVHVDRYIRKPCVDANLLKAVKELLDLRHQQMACEASAQKMVEKVHEFEKLNTDLERCVVEQSKEIRQTHALLDKSRRELKMQYLSAVKSFSNLIESRSPQLAAHGLRVAELARTIARK